MTLNINAKIITEKTPWNPSRKATVRVKAPLPIPCDCIRCNSVNSVNIVSNEVIYGTTRGEWHWAYICNACGAYTGLHDFTNIPLGTLADEPTRKARTLAKKAFNPLWEQHWMTRSEAYSWLSDNLGIKGKDQCHIGWMEVDQCKQTEYICKKFLRDRMA